VRLFSRFSRQRAAEAALMGGVALASLAMLAFVFFYYKYAFLVQRHIAGAGWERQTRIYAAPRELRVGETVSVTEVAAALERAGYRNEPPAAAKKGKEESPEGAGWFVRKANLLEIRPGRQSYFATEPAALQFSSGRLTRVYSLPDRKPYPQYRLEPEMISNLTDESRAKRRPVSFGNLPPMLIQAVLSAEDKHFFTHPGFDIGRIAKAAWVDLRDFRMGQGASTLTMQLARSYFLDTQKNWSRKAEEALITVILEQRLSKPRIFEAYANQIYLGRRGSFNIHGYGEAAWVFFGKEVRQLTLAESALLAGLAQRPGGTNPFRFPDRARARRAVVLRLMAANGYITRAGRSRTLEARPGIRRIERCALLHGSGQRGTPDPLRRRGLPNQRPPGLHHARPGPAARRRRRDRTRHEGSR
jgi:penicillin-binding protein 1B